jgi:hypothetical protein
LSRRDYRIDIKYREKERRMKQKAILALAAIVLLATFTAVAHATYGITEGVDGYVYGDGMPAQGITVHVYNSLNQLEGYGVEPGNVQGQLGTDITDASGYFHIAWLKGEGNTYKVVAETPVGDIPLYVQVSCGQTTRFNFYFEHCERSPGLTPGFWKNNLAVYLGLANGDRGYSDPTGSPTVTKDTMGAFFDSLAGTYDLNQLYRELCPQLDGTTADIRNAAANIFNVAAGLSPGPPWV